MSGTSASVVAALDPVLAGTAFDRAQGATPGRSSYLIWCTPASTFRTRHPDVREALDPDHPDGCIDLTVVVDDQGVLVRAEIEMMPLAGDLLGHPIGDGLPELARRLASILGTVSSS